MKKVLLSFLLLLLVAARASACGGASLDDYCIKTIDGVTYLTFKVYSACYTSGDSYVIWYSTSTSPSNTPLTQTSAVDNMDGSWTLTYELDVVVPDHECIQVAAIPWGGAGSMPNPITYGIEPVNVCPCEGCVASFSYCIKQSSGANPWDVTINMIQTPSTLAAVYDNNTALGDLSVSNTFNLDDGSHTICVNILGESGRENDILCSYCVQLCLGSKPKEKALKESNTTYTQSNKTGKYLSGVKIYPNPASDISKMEFNLQQDEQVAIELIDISGRIIRTIKDEIAIKGYHAVDINTAGIPSGTYIVRMRTGNSVSNYRLSVIK